MRPLRHLGALAATLAVLLLSGCVGGRVLLRVDQIDYPVSATQAVFDRNGDTVIPGEEQKIGHFSFGLTHWTMLWRAFELTPGERDLSAQLTREIEARAGNAIVNLQIEASGFFLPAYLSWLCGVLPSYVRVRVEGDVVRVE